MTNSNFVRVVLDTNILISAALKPHGLEARVINGVLAGTLDAYVTPQVWAEYEEVLARRKFAAVQAECARILAALKPRAHRIIATIQATAASDEDDNRFLECAHAAQAAFLVTGNLRHYPAEWHGARLVNARMLFEIIHPAQ